MATFVKPLSLPEALAEKKHNLGSDTLKVALTNTDPTTAITAYAGLSELANGSGYTTGGTAASISSSASSGGVYKLVLADVVFTASASMGPFRYAVLYNDTAAGKEVIGFWDYGSSITLATGETFTVDFDATNGVLQIS